MEKTFFTKNYLCNNNLATTLTINANNGGDVNFCRPNIIQISYEEMKISGVAKDAGLSLTTENLHNHVDKTNNQKEFVLLFFKTNKKFRVFIYRSRPSPDIIAGKLKLHCL